MAGRTMSSDKLNIVGASIGPPGSPRTYSGVPFHLFGLLSQRDHLIATIDSYRIKPQDVLTGLVSFRRSIKRRRPKKHPLWRFRPKSIKALSKRMGKHLEALPFHDSLLQIGVGGMPDKSVKLFAHAEISVKEAINNPIYGPAYDLERTGASLEKEVCHGERIFLERCDLIWTNSETTARTFSHHNIPRSKFFIYPPGVSPDHHRYFTRKWDQIHILFVGTQWTSKGGGLLAEAFEKIRKHRSDAQLTIVGCNPILKMRNVTIYPYLNKSHPIDLKTFNNCLKNATVFCMPSFWESTGLVYMEAALSGLPVVMLKGQGR